MVSLKKRAFDSMRPIKFVYDLVTSVPGSVLVILGNTKVLCTVSLQKGVPLFLRNTGKGWLTAEYAMLPNATEQRTARDSSSAQRNGRSVEISRLIGRVIRSVVDLSHIGEKTIYVDCDVLQADGGTRAAAITGTTIALELAQAAWLEQGIIKQLVLKERIAAVSVGLINNQFILDPDYAQDCLLTADFNIIMTAEGKLIELHGGAEKNPIQWNQLEQLHLLGVKGINTYFALMDTELGTYKYTNTARIPEKKQSTDSNMFSLGSRLQQANILLKE
ncbi:MAG TPA: ribonuclease PH [Patescibacteria group bacterium]|jgi:ribonuclease PH|nr:ribonuclease PH [Patescibacteria group bacterium]